MWLIPVEAKISGRNRTITLVASRNQAMDLARSDLPQPAIIISSDEPATVGADRRIW